MKNRNNFWTVGVIIFTVLLAISCRARSSNAASSGDVVESSSGAGTESAQTSAPSAQTAAPVSSEGGRTAAFFRIFESGTYHLAMDGGNEEYIEVYARNGMVSFEMRMEDEAYRVIQRDGRAYAIVDSLRMVLAMPLSQMPDIDIIKVGGLTTDQMRFVSSGTAMFDGRNLPYDEFLNLEGERLQFFIDGNRLAGIRSLEPGEPSDVFISELNQNFPDSVFDIPDDYLIQEM